MQVFHKIEMILNMATMNLFTWYLSYFLIEYKG